MPDAQSLENHRPYLERVCSRFLRDSEDIQDAVQETFKNALEHQSSFREEAALRTWLSVIAANVCKRTLMRRRHHVHDLLTELAELPDVEPGPVEQCLTHYLETELRAQIEAFIQDEAQRRRWRSDDYVLYLERVYQCKSFPQIAALPMFGPPGDKWRSRFHEKIRPVLEAAERRFCEELRGATPVK